MKARVKWIENRTFLGTTESGHSIAFGAAHMKLSTLVSCPHCAREAARYRRLNDGALVCSSCKRSFQPYFDAYRVGSRESGDSDK